MRARLLFFLTTLTATSLAQASLIHRWSFNNPAGSAPAGTTFTDPITGALGIVRGTGATLTGTQLLLPGTTNGNQTNAAIAAYLDLPNGLISSKTHLTIEFWADTKSIKNWQRLFDFGRFSGAGDTLGAPGEWTGTASGSPGSTGASDQLFLAGHRGTTANTQRLASRLDGGTEYFHDASLTTTAGTTYHYAVTFEKGIGNFGATGARISWFRNGTFNGSIDVPYQLSSIEDVNNWLGRSQWTSDSNANVAYDEFRIYDTALTSTQIAASFNAGANPSFPAPIAQPDTITMHPSTKALVAVLANDTGEFQPGTVTIVQPPQYGTASVDSAGRIRYTHTLAALTTDTLTYRVNGPGGLSNLATLTVQFSNQLRIPSTTVTLPLTPPQTTLQLINAFPSLAVSQPVSIAAAPSDSQRLFICEKGGLLRLIPNVTATTPTLVTFLNLPTLLTSRGESLASGGEQGLLGLAFHPNYTTNRYFYIFYSVTKAGVTYERVSRFTRQLNNPDAADPATELILIEQADEASNHNGGGLAFGPDGYLYISLGDEGGQNDQFNNSQRIDRDFFSAIARIDVDKLPGSLAPNPHPAIPTSAGVARFAVPPTNPFIGTTSFNGINISPTALRTEFYAVGLRNPWRFHFDSVTGELWCGDVGGSQFEEINLITAGGNYGWAFREGNVNGPKSGSAPGGFTSLPPLYAYPRGSGTFQGNSVTGGLVYRGNRIASLTGAYLFADYVSGNVWSLRRNGVAAPTVARITGQTGLVAFGTDPSNGDVLIANINTGSIQRLVSATVSTSYPETLSATGLFADLADLTPNPGILSYTPNLTFWSDFAEKQRWFVIPDLASQITWNRDTPWTFPTGQIWVKHFDLPLTRTNPPTPGAAGTRKRLETRLLVKTATAAYGVSYRWNDAHTDATLVPDEGASFPVNITENNLATTQIWQIPSRASCITCHTPQAGHALSFNTRQLNRPGQIATTTGNQIDLLHTAGYLANTPTSTQLLPRHIRPEETTQPLETRVRSYLAVNCAYCHQAGGTAAPAVWDGRPELTLAQTGLIRGTAINNGGDPANKLIVPGDTLHSVVLNRAAAANGFTRMPPLGSNQLDQVGIALLQQWIAALPARETYDEWRLRYFGNTTSFAGQPTTDADGDGENNLLEFLARTDPEDPISRFLTQIGSPSLGQMSFSFIMPVDRTGIVETSSDLVTWVPWDVPGNHTQLLPGPITLSGPATPPRQFFRLVLEEQ